MAYMTISISSIERGLREIKVWVTNRRDAANIGQRELVLVISIRNGTGFHDVVLSNGVLRWDFLRKRKRNS